MKSGGSKCQIYATVNNNQVEHPYTMVKSSCNINNDTIIILFDYGVTDSFISPYALDKSVLAACEHNDFNSVKMASVVKQAVRPSVDNCMVYLACVLHNSKCM